MKRVERLIEIKINNVIFYFSPSISSSQSGTNDIRTSQVVFLLVNRNQQGNNNMVGVCFTHTHTTEFSKFYIHIGYFCTERFSMFMLASNTYTEDSHLVLFSLSQCTFSNPFIKTPNFSHHILYTRLLHLCKLSFERLNR